VILKLMRLAACAVTIFATLTAPAQSQKLVLDGIWGNEEGCKALADGGMFEPDGGLTLTSDEIVSYTFGCEWLQALTATDGTQVVTGLCSHEGETYRTVETFVIGRDRFAGHARDGLARRELLEAPPQSTSALGPVDVDDGVPHLGSRACETAYQAAFDDEAAPDARTDREIRHVAGVSRGA
jgi:hypothetical protein